MQAINDDESRLPGQIQFLNSHRGDIAEKLKSARLIFRHRRDLRMETVTSRCASSVSATEARVFVLKTFQRKRAERLAPRSEPIFASNVSLMTEPN